MFIIRGIMVSNSTMVSGIKATRNIMGKSIRIKMLWDLVLKIFESVVAED